MEYLDIHKFDKGKLEASQGDFVLDEYNSSHALVALLSGSCRTHHCLRDGLRAGERVQSTEEQHSSGCVANVTSPIVGVLPTAFVVRYCALRIIDLYSATVVWSAHLKCFVESSFGRSAMRCWWWNLDEWKERVHKCTGVFHARELSEPEALGNTFKNPRVTLSMRYTVYNMNRASA